MKVEESLNVTFDETPPPPKTSPLEDDELVEEEAIEVSKTKPIGKDLEDISLEINQIVNIKESKTHPLENVIGTKHLGLWYPKGSGIEIIVYADSDCDNHELSRLDNQSNERDHLNGIGFVLDFVEFILFTFGDKKMILVIEAVSR
ncbi:hypothetical protein Tco_0950708 [Tanacetum coccineum]